MGDRGHGQHTFAVAASAQVGDAVFGDHDVAQVPRDGDVAVVPAHVGGGVAAVAAARPQHQRRTRVVEGMRHGDEVVLAADARHHAAILERVGNRRTQGRHHHAGVEEAGVAALFALERFVAAVELVDVRHAGHADAAGLFGGHLAQPVVERVRAQVEGAIEPAAIARQSHLVLFAGIAAVDASHGTDVVENPALENAGLRQGAEAVVDHFAGAVQACFKGRGAADVAYQRGTGQAG